MCGIAGAIDSNANGLTEKVSLANDTLSHRGPDGKGIESFNHKDKSIVLAHSRLSIIDLSDLGRQPMSSEDGQYWITYNGEVYNYKEIRDELIGLGYSFKSDTDTEVLLNSWIEWGDSCLTKLIGMFAFVIYDRNKKQIFCARDAFGIKPLYYYATKEKFYFSSEVPSLFLMMDHKKQLNESSIINYLLRGTYDVAENTFTKEVNSIKPGCFLTISLGDDLELGEERWWRPGLKENKNISFVDAAAKLRELFLKSVKLHMRSDVPIGAALSGGIDSSAIVCAMRYLEPDIPIHTFSYIASDSPINEEKWVDIVNNHVNAIPHKVKLNSNNLAGEIDDLIRIQGEPFGSTSIYAQYRVFKLAKDSGITVVLEGQGADELLAGYFGYPEHASMSYIDKRQYLKLFKFLYAWSKLNNQPVKTVFRYILSNMIKKLVENVLGYQIKKRITRYRKRTIPIWLLADHQMMNQAFDQIHHNSVDIPVLGRRLINELRRSLLGDYDVGINLLLRHGDRNAMKWSVENRVPFLTIEIAEFLFSLPERFLISKDGLTKNIFRHAMTGIVPDEILNRTDKIGFATPEKEWTSYINNAWARDVISEIDFLDGFEIQNVVKETLNGSRPFSWFAWRVINLACWLELNKKHIAPNVSPNQTYSESGISYNIPLLR